VPALSRFAVDLAGRVVAFEGDRPEWRRVLEPRYDAFRTARSAELAVELVTTGEVAGVESLARLRAEEWEILAPGPGALELRSPSSIAAFDLAAGRGRIESPLDRHGVDAVIRALAAIWFDDALLVHGALLTRHGSAWLVAGPSGAGKSTIAGLAGGGALCDELALLRRTGARSWRAHALPFWHGRPGRAPLRGVRLLEHGAAPRLRALGAEEARRRLLAEIVWPTFSAARVENVLELADHLLDEVEVAALEFRRAPDFWEALGASAREAAA
jgi:hypothetical protein